MTFPLSHKRDRGNVTAFKGSQYCGTASTPLPGSSVVIGVDANHEKAPVLGGDFQGADVVIPLLNISTPSLYTRIYKDGPSLGPLNISSQIDGPNGNASALVLGAREGPTVLFGIPGLAFDSSLAGVQGNYSLGNHHLGLEWNNTFQLGKVSGFGSPILPGYFGTD